MSDWIAELREMLSGRLVDLDVALHHIVDQVTEQLDADRGTLYIVDHASNMLVSRAAHLPEIAEIRLRVGDGVAGWVARAGEPRLEVRGGRQSKLARHVDVLTGYSTHSVIATPLRDPDGHVLAVLELLNKREGEFDDKDLTRLTRIAERVTGALLTSSLRTQLVPGARQPLAFRFNNIVGESAAMQGVYNLVSRAATTEATVLIRGASGTGKELFARAVHDNSARSSKPFVKVDCAALPEQLIENELFGHERGAYTGADAQARGKLDAAEGGTLFLDEVAELSPTTQGKLLRLLQERAFLRVGGTRALSADVRFVCATHRDLEQAVLEEDFRQDLYYRMKVVEIYVPPLRERGHGDLDRLIDHFLVDKCLRHGRDDLELAPAARAVLHAHDWPGNVRELEHCIESAVVITPEACIAPEHLSISSSFICGAAGSHREGTFFTEIGTLRDVEDAYIRHVLEANHGNRSATARVLGIARNTLLRKLDSR